MARTSQPSKRTGRSVKVTVLYVGSSLLAPLKRAEAQINSQSNIKMSVAAYNCGAPLNELQWQASEADIAVSDLVFVIHVTEGENALRISQALDLHRERHKAVIAFNCMPELMRKTRLGKLDFSILMKRKADKGMDDNSSARNAARRLATWMTEVVKSRSRKGRTAGVRSRGDQYLRLAARLPGLLRFLPTSGKLADAKHYIFLFCYFLQPTTNNIRSMLLYAAKHYVHGDASDLKIAAPESLPTVAIYHPGAPALYESYDDYRTWYEKAGRKLDPDRTIGLLLMRPQIVSDARNHYDGLIRAIEAEGLNVIPAISTFMDNRDACSRFFVAIDPQNGDRRALVSQIVSLTGFSFVGGPAMNDSEAAAEFINGLNVPFRSVISLDVQTIESWKSSRIGLNPIQSAMQVAIPEMDGATEPFIFGGLSEGGNQPEAIEERCRRVARRLRRWNKLQVTTPSSLKVALVVFCFPPNKGNIGTAADLDVFPSVWSILSELRDQGYEVDLPESAEELREAVLEGNSTEFGTVANVAYRLSADEYRRLCPYVADIETEWGTAPGAVNSNGREVLVLGRQFGNAFVAIQPTFGYEGDPMRLLSAESGSPHHGFAGLYTYLENIYRADAVIHVGTHGSLEFMPGKQIGLSERCWPDRLIGELPNIYIYSVNNPSEGTIAKRRSYAELVSYLTPPIENAGLYKEFAAMKELLASYRRSSNEVEQQRLFDAIEEKAAELNL